MLDKEYASKDLIPAGFEYLYVEADGKFVLKTSSQVERNDSVIRLEGSIAKERNDHKETKAKLSKFGSLDPTEVQASLDRIPELEAAAEGKLDETKIKELADKRAQALVGPVQRELDTLKASHAEAETQIQTYQQQDTSRKIQDHIRESAGKAKLHEHGISDALMYESIFEVSEDGRVITRADMPNVTPGVDATVWLAEKQATTLHWYPESQVGGSGGSGGTGGGGANPFSNANWNMTEQGALLNTDRPRAEAMAKAAGTTIGGPKPEK